ncbi:MAG TPA: hypothetical protein VNO43_18310 [Candidatus Eisenbacteria bacterium]|nr:hypothetical protein [Candidatus Eisenbacteria bacterium]
MEKFNLGSMIEDVIVKFSHNRVGDKPPIFLMVSTGLPPIVWKDQTIKEFVRRFLYDTLLTNDPDATVEVSVRRRSELRDIEEFVGIKPSYWVQLRVLSGGLKVVEASLEELLGDMGYRCEEWVGVETSRTRLGIFGTIAGADLKLIVCLESNSRKRRCELLLPICDSPPIVTAGLCAAKVGRV